MANISLAVNPDTDSGNQTRSFRLTAHWFWDYIRICVGTLELKLEEWANSMTE